MCVYSSGGSEKGVFDQRNNSLEISLAGSPGAPAKKTREFLLSGFLFWKVRVHLFESTQRTACFFVGYVNCSKTYDFNPEYNILL